MIKTLANIAIDQIQDGKKQFVSTFIKNEPVAKIMNIFIDTQAEYTKSAMALSIETTSAFGRLLASPDFYKVK